MLTTFTLALPSNRSAVIGTKKHFHDITYVCNGAHCTKRNTKRFVLSDEDQQFDQFANEKLSLFIFSFKLKLHFEVMVEEEEAVIFTKIDTVIFGEFKKKIMFYISY